MSQIELTAKHCHNVLVVAITPRLPNGQVDIEGVKRNVEFLVEHGVEVLSTGGSAKALAELLDKQAKKP